MKRIKIMGLCLIAVFAITAVAAGSASAAPTFKVCAKAAVKEGGTFNDKLCTVASAKGPKEGKYELADWTHAKKQGLKGKNGNSILKVFVKGLGVLGTTECAKAKDAGEITGASTTKTVAQFEKCQSSGKTCTSVQAGEKKGDITTFGLKGQLFESAQSSTKAAVEITGEGPGGESAEFNCEGEEISTIGEVSAEATGNVGVISKSSSNIFATNGEGEPLVNGAGPLLTTIVGVGTLESGEQTTAELKGEAEMIEL